MTNPITSPPELVQQWLDALFEEGGLGIDLHKLSMGLAARAAQWGADQELEACVEWLCTGYADIASRLRAARRPKPPRLKEQSLVLIDLIQGNEKAWDIRDLDVVRRALEALPE